MTSTTATQLAQAILDRLLAEGVREVVIAPGSRNAPLSFAFFDAARAGVVRLHTRIDERSAGFLALGMSRNGPPAAVLCTSGTAVANLHPAVLEAAHAGLGLWVVTADRPARLRGTNANQTTDQVGIFGDAAPCIDLVSPADLAGLDSLAGVPMSGPVHLNVQFDEPLLPTDRRTDFPAPTDRPRPAFERTPEPITLGPRTVVVAGDDSGPPARVLAQEAEWPLIAEPSSGSRTGTHALRCGRLLLDGPLGDQIERVIVFGHPTLSRPVSRLLTRRDVEVWAAPALGHRPTRPFPVAREFTALEPEGYPDLGWRDQWWAADRDLGRRLDDLLAGAGLTPYAVAGAVSAALTPDGLLVVGASSPIRDLDLMVARYEVGKRRKVIANRGLAGIDGTISTAIGAALARRGTSRAFALLGDVTFLHDSNGLIRGPGQPEPDLTIVVVNDNGGSIFAMLEQGAPEYADRFEALFGTPHDVDLAALCQATRTPHWRVERLEELQHALAAPNGGVEVIEAVVRRDNRRELDLAIRALAKGTGHE